MVAEGYTYGDMAIQEMISELDAMGGGDTRLAPLELFVRVKPALRCANPRVERSAFAYQTAYLFRLNSFGALPWHGNGIGVDSMQIY